MELSGVAKVVAIVDRQIKVSTPNALKVSIESGKRTHSRLQ